MQNQPIYATEFKTERYWHYINLYHELRQTSKSAMFPLAEANKLASEIDITIEQHKLNKLPRVDIAALFGCKGSIAGDGEE